MGNKVNAEKVLGLEGINVKILVSPVIQEEHESFYLQTSKISQSEESLKTVCDFMGSLQHMHHPAATRATQLSVLSEWILIPSHLSRFAPGISFLFFLNRFLVILSPREGCCCLGPGLTLW